MKLVTKEGVRRWCTGELAQIQHMLVRAEIGTESPELIMCRAYLCVATDCKRWSLV